MQANAAATLRSREGRKIALADLPAFSEKVSEAKLAPNGKWLAVVRDDGSLQVLELTTAKLIRELGVGFAPVWSPNSKFLAFYSQRSGNLQLWKWNSVSAECSELTSIDGGVDADPATRIAGSTLEAMRASWSPDGDRLVFASRVPVHEQQERLSSASSEIELSDRAAPLVLTESTPPHLALAGIFSSPALGGGLAQSKNGGVLTFKDRHSHYDGPSQLLVVDVRTNSVQQITRGPRTWFHPTWSPNGKTIAAVAAEAPGIQLDTSSSEIVLIDSKTWRVRTLAVGTGLKYQPRWSTNGAVLAYLSMPTLFGWPTLQVANVDWPDLAKRLNYRDRYIVSFAWSFDGDSFLLTYKDGTSTRIGKLDQHTADMREISLRSDTPISVGDFSEGPNGDILWQQYDPKDFTTLRYLQKGISEPIILARFNTHAQEFDLGEVQIIRWRNARGDAMEGTVLLPPGFTPDREYPLIVDAYPLISGANWSDPMLGNLAWGSLGYIVFRPSPRAPHTWMNPWTSEGWSLAAKGANGWSIALDDLLSAVDALLERGIVDSDRMCMYGFSNGGGVVNYALTRTHRFACAISVAPALSDWVRPMLLNPAFKSTLAGVDFESGIEDYITLSAVFHLSSVDTPLLIASGDNDGAVLDSIEMYNGLRRQGKKVTFIRYPGQGHGFKDEALLDFWGRELEFFKNHLAIRRKPEYSSESTEKKSVASRQDN